jgi:hypothetical protein
MENVTELLGEMASAPSREALAKDWHAFFTQYKREKVYYDAYQNALSEV